jgi:hypothetical protein
MALVVLADIGLGWKLAGTNTCLPVRASITKKIRFITLTTGQGHCFSCQIQPGICITRSKVDPIKRFKWIHSLFLKGRPFYDCNSLLPMLCNGLW